MTPRYDQGRTFENEALKAQLTEKLTGTYPAAFELSQRIRISLAGKKYDLAGALKYQNPGSIRAIASGEMGGKVFDFDISSSGTRIIKSPPRMPIRPLSHGAIGDIVHLYHWQSCENSYLVQRAPNLMGLVVPMGDDRFAEYQFDADRNLARTLEAEQGRVVRDVLYSDFREFEKWNRPLPARIRLKNYQWHYAIEIQLLRVHVKD